MMRGIMFFVSLFCCLLSVTASAEEVRNVDLLVSSCAACHGTNGHSVSGTPKLAGLSELHFIEQMNEFRSGERPSTVMFHHASGYTKDEIALMAEFFSKQNN